MQQTSELYKQIIAETNHSFEVSLTIGESGRLVTETSDLILFGGDAILVDTGAADTGYREAQLFSVKTTQGCFSGSVPEVGCAISGEIDVRMIAPLGDLPRRARIALYIRATDGVNYSEWLPQGVYYIDTKETEHNDNGLDIMTIHGYDAMMLSERNYTDPNGVVDYSEGALDTDLVEYIASQMKPDESSEYGISIDERTWDIMTHGYRYTLPIGYTLRECLSLIAASYGGNFIITAEGQLRLIALNELPKETRVLIDELGFQLVFGTDDNATHILV